LEQIRVGSGCGRGIDEGEFVPLGEAKAPQAYRNLLLNFALRKK
jgi:hypothetical protein